MNKKRKISIVHFVLVIIIAVQLMLSWCIEQFEFTLSMPMALVLSQLSILVPFLVYCIVGKQNPWKVIRFKKTKPISIFFAFLIAIFSYPVVIFLNMISMLFVENAVSDLMPAVLSMGLLPGLLFMAFMPAFVEETIFRGMLYNTYSKYRPIAGIILSAVLFGFMHMNFNQLPYAIYLGIIMAIMMEVCDSIVVPMVIHFTMNGASTVLSFVSTGILQASGEAEAATDLKTAFMESYATAMEEFGIEMTQAQMDSMFPVYMAGILLVFAIFAIGALAIIIVLLHAVANINERPLKEVFRKRETEEKVRFIDIWLILFLIYTLYQCVVSVG